MSGDDCILYYGYIVWLSMSYCCFSWRNFRNRKNLNLASHDHTHIPKFTLAGWMLGKLGRIKKAKGKNYKGEKEHWILN